jgi:hypothetical protein
MVFITDDGRMFSVFPGFRLTLYLMQYRVQFCQGARASQQNQPA